MSEDVQPIDNQDMADILKKMQQQLDAIERKVDALLKQAAPREFKSSYPSRPRKEFSGGRPTFNQKYGKRKEEGSGEGKPFSKFSKRRDDGAPSEGSHFKDRPFNKKKEGGKGGFAGKKKFSKK